MSSKQKNDNELENKNENIQEEEQVTSFSSGVGSVSRVPVRLGEDTTLNLSKMYQTWFLDYASYVILERAVPHISDGLKPVQRRIMHSMKRMDDGRYNKCQHYGNTMQFHPHGDASMVMHWYRWDKRIYW